MSPLLAFILGVGFMCRLLNLYIDFELYKLLHELAEEQQKG